MKKHAKKFWKKAVKRSHINANGKKVSGAAHATYECANGKSNMPAKIAGGVSLAVLFAGGVALARHKKK
ncbi:MAG: hypothetical protein KH345_01685 [Eubacterium sp.]|jgi:hypothetical protein|nr:hypothetical protein [Eubacterium sp.]